MVKVKYIWFPPSSRIFSVHNHIHNCYEIIYYFKAKGHTNYFAGQKEIDVKEEHINYIEEPINDYSKEEITFKDNTLVLFSPKVVHDETHEIPPDVMDIGLEIDDLNYTLPTLEIDDYSNEFEKIFQLIKKEYLNKENFYQDYIESLCEELVIKLNRKIKGKTEKQDPITLAKNFIKENFTTEIDLNNLAKLSGYSIDHFRFLFKGKVGLSPKEYIIKKRISLACTLLKETNYPISKVSNFVGYSDVSQFSAIFKKKIGLTPLTYKKNNEDN